VEHKVAALYSGWLKEVSARVPDVLADRTEPNRFTLQEILHMV
jgi:hypothetical protein